ncbi:MAG TPA: hypothetical protein VNT22_00570 [Baekduia sp.]|nr:hypothetical protein [Baekduia sp.]
MHGIGDREDGQAAVELVALLPLIVGVGALILQAALAGQALWLSQAAARSAARELAVGTDREAQAATHALPARLRRGMQLKLKTGGDVEVRVRIPALIGGNLGSVTGRARMEPQR